MIRRAAPAQLWIVPALDGPITGGTLYNRRLMAALATREVRCSTQTLEAFLASPATPTATPPWVWLDSLYLEHAERVRACLPESASLGLVLHYLPSLLAADERELATLVHRERAAILQSARCLVTSETLRASVLRLVPRAACLCIEPGVDVTHDGAPAPPASQAARQALMIANLTPNKRILPFLQALAARVLPSDVFELSIVGSHELAPRYAEQCARTVASDAQLRTRVSLAGACAHRDVMQRLAKSQWLVSASRMESYGMALAEARALGVPLLACTGGHIAQHVLASAGGELVADEDALADAFLRLARIPGLLDDRRRRAQRSLHARSWSDAARELIAASQAL